jgi:hypothetical protein
MSNLVSEQDVLRDVTQRLGSAGIAYMLTGSWAMNYYAEPRMTRDIDLVVLLETADAERVIALFEPDYYVPQQTLKQAIRNRSMFNVIHKEGVIKVDFILLKDDPYQQAAFARRQQVTYGELPTWIITLEDLILAKLLWAKDSQSEMQLRDVQNLLAVSPDRALLQSWATDLGVAELLAEVSAHGGGFSA